MKKEMKWTAFLTMVLVFALGVASAESSIACVVTPSNHSQQANGGCEFPPCHHHSPSKNAPPDCRHLLLIAETHALVKIQTAGIATIAALPLSAVDATCLRRTKQVSAVATSPPFSPDLTFATILQI